MKISNCCGAAIRNTDIDLCPQCHEHCEFEDDEELEGTEGQDRENYTDTQDRESYVPGAPRAR